MDQVPKVALLIETARGYGRQMLRGIVKYARLHGPWGFYVTPGDFEQAVPKMRQWGGTGIIARIATPRIADAIFESKLPTIALDLTEEQLRPDHPLSQLSEVASDSASAARMAATHLMQRGFRQFAFVGIADRVWSDRRETAFVQAIKAAGFDVTVYQSPRQAAARRWEREHPRLIRWLEGLPKPIGVMTCNDDRGREVLEACQSAGIRVPEELAVVGVDNDELICELADPPLSSVALNAEGVGYRAAQLLDRMMRRRWRKPRRLVAEPLHVVTRRSSDIISLDDAEVAMALRYIHDHAIDPIQVENVVRHVDLSRRNLEIRFQDSVGRTMHQELQRVRLERAKQFLTETNIAIPEVAEAVGYRTASYFIQVFRASCGMTPAQYRRSLREGPSQKA
ncbi:xylose operon transcription regulator XylR [Crateriforma conspicua]|uniref:Xylose operon regulatory protein n=1 Tax=Crateriforma conspicua TaxID=2527996 RepID=A0A5C6FRU0_9PLAN|nr:DNA-binding transcriptional regulator [Crateriforma conspicua]TWU63278.1 Xylose operon regulatory protein [Crateriforma conspicua]